MCYFLNIAGDNIYKDNYFYFILLYRVLAISVSWFFEIYRVLVSRRVVSVSVLLRVMVLLCSN